MANQYGIDLAGALSSAESIKSARTNNKLSFIDAVSKMDDRKIEATKKAVEEIGQLSAYVLQGSTPEEQQRRYSLMRKGVGADVKSKLPEAFDSQFMEMSLTKAMAMDKILENPKAVTLGGEDILYKGGREVERADVPVKDSSSSSGGGGLKSADESLMYRQSAELLGGLFDQSGNITNLDPDVRNKVQGIATEATTIFKQGGVTRTQAVKQAAKKFGLNIQEPQEADQQSQSQYTEGQRAKDGAGNVLVFTNGQWLPQ